MAIPGVAEDLLDTNSLLPGRRERREKDVRELRERAEGHQRKGKDDPLWIGSVCIQCAATHCQGAAFPVWRKVVNIQLIGRW